MYILKRIYTVWCFFWFTSIFIALLPFFYLFTISKKTYEWGHHCYRVWSHLVYTMSFLPVKIEYHYKPKVAQPCVYCPNHTSFWDIPALYRSLNTPFCFIGKSSLKKIPVFGYLYGKLHILVDRKSKLSRYDSIFLLKERIAQNQSVVVFPEGTIPDVAPRLSDFKDGAFRVAIEMQVPIVPMTIPYNWRILPSSFIVSWHSSKIIFHDAIHTKGMTLADLPELKKRTFEVIENELKRELGSSYM